MDEPPRRGGTVLLLALGAVFALAACSSPRSGPVVQSPPASASVPAGSSPATGARTPDSVPATTAVPTPTATTLALLEVARLEQPVALAARAGDDTLYLADRIGHVRALRDGRLLPQPVLDISARTVARGEQGFLGLTFSPDGDRVYVSYTDRNGDSRLDEYRMRGDAIDVASRREILAVDQPYSNHNGGHVVFGPDGHLWLGLGDGGGAGDPRGNAQRLDTLLGKLLRIDPAATSGSPYRIPSENPFTAVEGARGEIWAYGLRNPWRFSFDRQTGDLWIGDVGQNAVEEIDFVAAGSPGGQNFGWDRLEGTHAFEGDAPQGAVAPVFEYPRAQGRCAVTGGFVYRGHAVPHLAGNYLYGDFCEGRLNALATSDGRVTGQRSLGVTVAGLASFGEDAAGEVYVLSLEGPVYRLVAGG